MNDWISLALVRAKNDKNDFEKNPGKQNSL